MNPKFLVTLRLPDGTRGHVVIYDGREFGTLAKTLMREPADVESVYAVGAPVPELQDMLTIFTP